MSAEVNWYGGCSCVSLCASRVRVFSLECFGFLFYGMLFVFFPGVDTVLGGDVLWFFFFFIFRLLAYVVDCIVGFLVLTFVCLFFVFWSLLVCFFLFVLCVFGWCLFCCVCVVLEGCGLGDFRGVLIRLSC